MHFLFPNMKCKEVSISCFLVGRPAEGHGQAWTVKEGYTVIGLGSVLTRSSNPLRQVTDEMVLCLFLGILGYS